MDPKPIPLPGLGTREDGPEGSWPQPGPSRDPDLLRLAERLGSSVQACFEQAGECTCQVAPAGLLDALHLCKEDPALAYDMLADETAVHYPQGEGFAFALVYHLLSIPRGRRLRLRCLIPEGFEPPSAVPLYPAANWAEREIFDMFGIRFQGHPNLQRILCADDWDGHPLRKDYPLKGRGRREHPLAGEPDAMVAD